MADQPASQADIQKLENILEKLVRVMSSQTPGVKPSYTNSGSNDPNYKALENVIKNNGSLSNEIQKAMAKLKAGSLELSKVIDTIDSDTKHMSDTSRKAAAATVEYIKQTGKAVESLKALTSLKNNVNAFVELPKKIEELNRDIQKQVEERNELRKKAKTASEEDMKGIAEERKTMYDNFVKLNEELTEAKNNAAYFAADVKEFNDTTKILSDVELAFVKDIKNLEKDSKEYNRIIAKLMEGTAGLEKGISSTAGSLASSSGHLESAAKGFKLSLMNAGKLLVTTGIPTLFKDYLAELRNNVKNSNYSGDAMMGISESDRSDLIGSNRTNLRSLGKGSEYTGFDQNLKELQTVARQFGVYGKAGLETALLYQKQAIEQGHSGSNTAAIANRMTFMHHLADQVGQTDDALADYVDTLNKTGQLQALNSKYSNKSEEERQKLVNKEIQQRMQINTLTGMSIEQMKQQAMQNQSAGYTGIEDYVKGIINNRMYNSMASKSASSQYQLTNKETDITNKVASMGGSDASLSDAEKAIYQNAITKRAAGQVDYRGKIGASGNSGLAAGLAVRSTLMGNLGFGDKDQESDLSNRYKTAQGRAGGATAYANQMAAAMGGDTTGGSGSVIGQMSDQYMNSIDKTRGSLGKLGDSAITAAQTLDGLSKNPAGAAAGAAGSGALDFIQSYLALRGGEKIAGAGMRAAGVSATTDVGALAGGGLAGIASIVAGVVASAAVGYAIGTIIHNMLPDKVNMGMGKGIAYMLSSIGVDSATNSLAMDAAGEDAASKKYTFYDSAQGKYINSATPPTPAQQAGITAHQAQIKTLRNADAAGSAAIQAQMPSMVMQTIQESLNDPDNKGLASIADTLESMYGISKEQLETMKKKNKDDKEKALADNINTVQDGSYYKNALEHFQTTIQSVRR